MRPLHLIALLAVIPACLIESRNVNIGQVPRPSIPFATAAPTSGIGELTAGASALPTVTDPKNKDRASGAEVPDTQARGELRFRVRDSFWIGAAYERGFGHQQVDDSLPNARSGNVSGWGVMMGGTIHTDESSPWRIGWTATAMDWTVPYDQYSTVTVDVLGLVSSVAQYQHSDSDTTGTFGFGLWPSYTSGALRIFGGAYATQVPTVHLFTKDSTFIGPTIETDQEDVIGNDRIDLVAAAGIEYSITRELSITAILNQEVLGAVMRTGPSVQLGASVRLGERASDRRKADPVAPPPAPGLAPAPYTPPPPPPPFAPPPPGA